MALVAMPKDAVAVVDSFPHWGCRAVVAGLTCLALFCVSSLRILEKERAVVYWYSFRCAMLQSQYNTATRTVLPVGS